MTPKKPDWFEMTEGDTPATGLRKVNKTLPIGALLVAGALLFGGSLFAQDQSAVAVQTKTASHYCGDSELTSGSQQLHRW
jgi:hypothetical protein